MSDHGFEELLSRRLKRATANVAAVTPRNLGGVASTSGSPRAPARSLSSRRVRRSPIAIAAVVILGLALASGTTYAGVTLLQAITQTDPGAAAVYRQNLGEALHLSATVDGVTVALQRAYADVNRVMVTYDVKPPPGTTSVFAGFNTPTGQPSAVELAGSGSDGIRRLLRDEPPDQRGGGHRRIRRGVDCRESPEAFASNHDRRRESTKPEWHHGCRTVCVHARRAGGIRSDHDGG